MTVKPDFASEKDRHNWVISHAEYFSTVVFMGRGRYERIEWPTLEMAERAAQTLSKALNKKVMIYAVAGTSDALVKVV